MVLPAKPVSYHRPAKPDCVRSCPPPPQAAGHAALVRQYLRTGFYPTGSPADAVAAPFTPSGMLLKAMVIAGAKSMEVSEAQQHHTRLRAQVRSSLGLGRRGVHRTRAAHPS